MDMIKFYFDATPNPMKVALFLEEARLDYELVPVDIRKGEQFKPEFVPVNPNSKVPALIDGDAVIFDSNAILLYLAEKTGKFLPGKTDVLRGELLSWLMFVATGVGPFSGQCAHFRHFAPEPKGYAVQRYVYEAERHWRIIDERLAKREFMVGETYTIVDMAVWGWARTLPFTIGQDCWDKFPSIKPFMDHINGRPAAPRAEALKDRHAFKQDFDDEARRHLFPQVRAA
jgi:GSH-dependent disulfide-bond oxidoreductase